MQGPNFGVSLFDKVRNIYTGKLTYAANWDNYENVGFWDQLDFVGIDAYFQINKYQNARLESMIMEWESISSILFDFSKELNKTILFTEYGFRSSDYSGFQDWKEDNPRVNLENQKLAYQALFESIWKENWFDGGFLWKWFPHHQVSGGTNHSGFTPQNKPAEAVITKYYTQ